MLLCAVCITLLEFISGVILNIWLKLNIWDYSYEPLNVLGQICLPFMAIWFALSLPAMFLDKIIRRMYNEAY